MSRIGYLACAAALACSADAQDLTGLMRGTSSVLIREKLIEPITGAVPGQDQLEPPGHPGLPPREGTIPPRPEDTRKFVEIIDSGTSSLNTGTRFLARGGIHVRYRGYDIVADEVDINLETEVVIGRGNVKIIGQDVVITGQVVEVNTIDATFRAEHSDTQLRPSFVQGRVLDDLYIRGDVAYGSEREMWGEAGSFTTCNLDHPHYQVHADRVNLRPGRRVIMRDVAFELLGKKLFSIPYLAIPLDERGERYTPEVGQSPDEGYFIKNYIGVPTGNPNDFLQARLDYMTKLGLGLGGNYDYARETLGGIIGAYAVLGAVNTLNVSNEHRQRIGSVEAYIRNEFQRNNYLNAPESTLWGSNATLSLAQPNGTQSSFNFQRNSNQSGGFNSVSQNFSLQDQRTWNARTRSNINVTYSDVRSGAQGFAPTRRENIDLRLNAQHDIKQALAQIEYIRSIPVGETANYFGAADRTPVFSLRTDNRRLPILPLNFNSEFSLGEFVTGNTGEKISRGMFDFNFNRPDPSRNRSTLAVDGRFRQTMYSDDTAQYVARLGVNYRYRLGSDTGLNLRYNFLRPYGFTPLSLDRIGTSNFLSADLNVRPIRSLLLGAGTGYDFLREEREQIAWQTVALRAEYTPRDWFQLRAYSTYDPVQHAFNNVRFDLAYFPGATRVYAGLRYDGIRHTWGNANLRIEGLKWGRLMASMVITYNGYLKQFEARHFDFSYDLHCAEAVLQIIDNPVGFRRGTQISFFFRLEAFPFNTPFGTDRRGAPIGTGTGLGL